MTSTYMDVARYMMCVLFLTFVIAFFIVGIDSIGVTRLFRWRRPLCCQRTLVARVEFERPKRHPLDLCGSSMGGLVSHDWHGRCTCVKGGLKLGHPRA